MAKWNNCNVCQKKKHQSKGIGEQQKALVIMDVFTRQINSTVKGVLEENHILATNVTANMTLFYQPLDLTMNGGAKRFIAKKFNSWYSQQICDKRSISNCVFCPKINASSLCSGFLQLHNNRRKKDCCKWLQKCWDLLHLKSWQQKITKHGSLSWYRSINGWQSYHCWNKFRCSVSAGPATVWFISKPKTTMKIMKIRRKHGKLKNIIQMHSTYLITLMTNHLCKILHIFWTPYVMIEKIIFITWKSVDCIFFFLNKRSLLAEVNLAKFLQYCYLQNFLDSFICGSLSKKFCNFFCSQKFLSRKFLQIK